MPKKKVDIRKLDGKVFLIISLVIAIIAIALIGNFSGKTITTLKTTVTISPDVIKPGEYVNIKVNPTIEGVYKQYWVCKENDLCPARFNIHCGGPKCKTESKAQYKTPTEWDGIYYVKVFDYKTKSFIKTYFTVTNE